MSRSRKKIPISGITMARSEKSDKRMANRKLRRIVKASDPSNDKPLPMLREVSDVWLMAKDGKIHVDPVRFPKVLRK